MAAWALSVACSASTAERARPSFSAASFRWALAPCFFELVRQTDRTLLWGLQA